ncbi:Rne/Rng family ribonuclease [Brevibacillus fluminis]|uniref:Rne/Rng family ribonuclease n=1 Tax=Brevibacillus fluminis TaxID=511487 RepID=A0A3M8DT81_9BACL|nr:Rne/Rng family ribonuclease [Brevibacillus fluminis]
MDTSEADSLKRILIEAYNGNERIAVLENGRLAELYLGADGSGQILGNIYRVRIQKVLPAMQAAFVDAGPEGNFYLYIDDALPPSWKEERGTPKPNIRDLVREGEERIVQVSKEAVGSKSPSASLDVGLPGRMLVYQPFAGGQISISRKLDDEKERLRLKQAVTPLLAGTEGVILRTQAEGASAEELGQELAYLRSIWTDALADTAGKKVPCLIYQDADPLLKMIRDTASAELDELVIGDFTVFSRVKRYVAAVFPDMLEKLSFYQGKQPLFDVSKIDDELHRALQREITLPSGGSLVIDQTEAMTVIDVNTGKFTGKAFGDLEETVTRTNREAAKEIAYQLRLRDIGGIIIIDFIDMKKVANRERVQAELTAALAADRSPGSVLGFTKLGLMEMTRKKSRQTLSHALTVPCSLCSGKGRVLSGGELLYQLERDLQQMVRLNDIEAAVIELPAELHEQAREMAKRLSIELLLGTPDSHQPGSCQIRYAGSLAEARAKAERMK